MADKVRIAIVGGGRTGTPLIEQFMDIPYVELMGVADVDPESPGAQLAKDNGVFFTTPPRATRSTCSSRSRATRR
jgi:predicted dehydrogenase